MRRVNDCIVHDSDRGTGRTTRQLEAAPDEFWFVVGHSGQRDYVEWLRRAHVPDKKIRIVTPDTLEHRMIGSLLPVVVDHAAWPALTMRHHEFLFHHAARAAALARR